MQSFGKEETLHAWDVSWPIMNVLIGGYSSIDMASLSVRDMKDATAFVQSYGYDPDREDHGRFIHAVIIEALAFIERHLMPDEWKRGRVPPDEILFCDDVRHLLLYASGRDKASAAHRHWSCAVLRVMHTIAHIEGVHTIADLDAARKQVVERFDRYVQKDADGTLYLGDDELRIPLQKIEWKFNKTRDSIILKLLHKRANVAETIYDILGVRIVTSKLCDVVLAVRMMQHFYMVTFPNCNPSRARNTLFDLESFRKEIDSLRDQLKDDDISAAEFQAKVAEIVAPIENVERSNPHSASTYKAVQFTCRQLVRWPNPLLSWLSRMNELCAGASGGPERKAMKKLVDLVQGWSGVQQEMELSGFFPFEVQVMDRRAYSQNQFGDASHDRYKRSQGRAARRRVLGKVLELYEQ